MLILVMGLPRPESVVAVIVLTVVLLPVVAVLPPPFPLVARFFLDFAAAVAVVLGESS